MLIDRHILVRFLTNFVVLFTLLFVFGIAIDLILNLDKFVEATDENLRDKNAGQGETIFTLLRLIADFQGPRLFQFYGYLHGVVIIGAMGFTLAQMHKFKELVAVLAAGVSLQRLAMPFIVGAFVLSLVQLVNQEFFLPRVAPLLLRNHGDIGKSGLQAFEVELAAYGPGRLLHAASFDPRTAMLIAPTFLDREERGVTKRRISAERAVWDEAGGGWRLEQGVSLRFAGAESGGDNTLVQRDELEFLASDISPRTLTVRHHAQFAGMLSLRQIADMLQGAESRDSNALRRHRYARFSTVLVNILVLVITLPSFLLREPANLLMQSVTCAGLALPCQFGAILGMSMALPGLPPAAGVFLPAILLIPIALARVTFIRT
jgi:lipopolysaccharide export LptBFGC system permease protein LptF